MPGACSKPLPGQGRARPGVGSRRTHGATEVLRKRARWRALPRGAATAAPALHPCLHERGSLSEWLRAHGAELRVLRLRQGRRAGAVGPLWTREVLLLLDGRPVVWARSVLDFGALRGPWRALRGFGTLPLGDWLFARADVKRGPVEVRRLGAADPLARAAQRALRRHASVPREPRESLTDPGPAGWARRSAFVRRGCALWLTELFLPAAAELRRRT